MYASKSLPSTLQLSPHASCIMTVCVSVDFIPFGAAYLSNYTH